MDAGNTHELLQTRELFDRLMKRVNTCIPGRIQSFDSDTQTCVVTPAVKPRVWLDGETTDITPPTLHNVPLVFPFAPVSGFALTIPVRAGDPCLLVFSQRCIDNWHQLGGIQSAETGGVGARHHDINDGFAILCAPPIPDVLTGWCEDGIEIRNRARTVRMTIRDDGVEVDGPTVFLKPVTFEQTVNVKGVTTLEAAAVMKAATTFEAAVALQSTITSAQNVELGTHHHGGVEPGSGISGDPE